MLSAKDLIVGRGGTSVAGPLDFEFGDGELVMLTGPNGSGKSTLLKTIAGLLRPLGGSFAVGRRVQADGLLGELTAVGSRVQTDGLVGELTAVGSRVQTDGLVEETAVSDRGVAKSRDEVEVRRDVEREHSGRPIGRLERRSPEETAAGRQGRGVAVMVPTHIPKVNGFTVREFVRTSLSGGRGFLGRLDKLAEARVEDAVRLLGLEALAEKDLSRISDGEFQRACIATALTRNADVILLDEPTAFLDVDNRRMVLQTLRSIAHGELEGPARQWGAASGTPIEQQLRLRMEFNEYAVIRSKGPTILFSTHDIYDGAEFSDKELKLSLKH